MADRVLTPEDYYNISARVLKNGDSVHDVARIYKTTPQSIRQIVKEVKALYTFDKERDIVKIKKKPKKKLDNAYHINKLERQYFVLHYKLRGFDVRGGKQQYQNNYTIQDVLNKFGKNPSCYLSGLDIDYHRSESYSLDHVIPVSIGGNNTLDNMNIIYPRINIMKLNLLNEEFVKFCKLVAQNNVGK